MSILWVILNDDKSALIEAFETIEADSKPHWEKFYQHKQGNVFSRRTEDVMRFNKLPATRSMWFVNYFYWEDMSRWGYGDPTGIGWSACMAIPEIVKMVEVLE